MSVLLVLALSVNFLLYSSQSYSPPRADSISYSIVNCPSHEADHHTNIVQIFMGSDREHGSEKDCFCYDCCSQRVSLEVIFQELSLVLKKYSTKFELLSESIHIEDSYKNLPIRSPPTHWA